MFHSKKSNNGKMNVETQFLAADRFNFLINESLRYLYTANIAITFHDILYNYKRKQLTQASCLSFIVDFSAVFLSETLIILVLLSVELAKRSATGGEEKKKKCFCDVFYI